MINREVFLSSERQFNSYVKCVIKDVPKSIEKQKGPKAWGMDGAEILDVLLKNNTVDEFTATMKFTNFWEGISL